MYTGVRSCPTNNYTLTHGKINYICLGDRKIFCIQAEILVSGCEITAGHRTLSRPKHCLSGHIYICMEKCLDEALVN